MTRLALLAAVFALACAQPATTPRCHLHYGLTGERFVCPAGQAEVRQLDDVTLCCPLTREELAR